MMREDPESLSDCKSNMPVSNWLHLPRWLLMGAGGWDSRCDIGTSSSHLSSPFTQVRRWGRYRGHGGGHPSHCSPCGWGLFCTTFCPHPCLLQRDLCLPYLVGGGLPAHQQPVRRLLSPVSHAELSWATPPACRLCALWQANRDPEENTWAPPTQTRCASEGLILTGDHDVFGLRHRECWSIDLEAFLLKRMNLFATQALKINGESAEGKYEKLLKKVWKMFLWNTLLLQIESLNDFEELALFIQKFMWCNTKCLVSQGFVIRIFPPPALH